jgi:hypothetical protein
MSILSRSLPATAAVAALIWTTTWSIPAQALTMQECGAKYRAAQTAKTLNGMTWREFRKTECGAGAATGPSTSTNGADTAAAPTTNSAKPSKTTRIFNTAPTTDQTNAIFPAAVSPKYAAKSAGLARRLTCLDQYEANKAGNMNGGLRWIQKGGGYYSMCNKRLKGA